MNHPRPMRLAGLLSAGLLWAGQALAGPVVLAGSSYSLSLTQATTPSGFDLHTLTFDGVAETFTHRSDGPVTVTVQESQADLGGGRWAIDIELVFQGGDPFPNTVQGPAVGIGSSTPDAADSMNGLDTTRPVELTAFSVAARTADGQDLLVDYFPNLGWLATVPWNGLSAGGFLVVGPWAQLGLQRMTIHFETQDLQVVSNPGTAPLLALGLLALAGCQTVRRRA